MASKGRILVVDDDRLVLAAVTHGLAQAGYEVVDADNGDEAILKARQLRPEIALLDIRMEGKSGFDVAEYLRDVAHIPFMFLSAFADDATIAKVNELGAVAYLIKPLDIDQILPTVDEAVARLRAGELAPAPASQPVPAPAPTPVAEPMSDPLPLAVGVLMHRHSLTRVAARQRLQRMAAEQGISEAAQAERLIAAVEELARSA